jgi:hypothetical protein
MQARAKQTKRVALALQAGPDVQFTIMVCAVAPNFPAVISGGDSSPNASETIDSNSSFSFTIAPPSASIESPQGIPE